MVTTFDFLAVSRVAEGGGDELAAEHVLVRLVRCESGSARLRIGIEARPGYGLESVGWGNEREGVWRASNPDMWLSCDAPLERKGGELCATARLRAG